MRFERIELPAFGPFTDFALDLSARPRALHVVYGQNEAGKSSLLRALTALLYGVHTRSLDGHLHDFTRLRIAASLRTPSGELLQVVRRKGNKNTLLDRDEKPLPDNLLAPLLGGLDEPLFSQMFGLDHVRLREGAEALLRGGGHVGEGLFDAGTGARAIRQAVDALRSEAEELYKPKGRTPKLNASVERLREQKRKLRDAMLSPQVYAEQQKAVAEVLAAREAASARRRELLREQAKLARQLALFPLLGRHAALSLEQAEAKSTRADDTSAQPFARPELGEELRALEQRVAVSLAFHVEQPERAAELAVFERDAELLASRLGAVAACACELDTPARARLRALAERERTIARDRSELTRTLLTERERLARVEARLVECAPAHGAHEALTELVERSVQADLLGALARSASELAREAASLERGAAQLGTTLAAPALARLALPSEALLGELESQYASHEREAERLHERKDKLASQRLVLARRRAELLADGELASERDLAQTHAARAHALSLLVAAWRAGAAFEPTLVQDYERTLQRGDELAARMRAEARRHSELVRCDAEAAQLDTEQGELAHAQLALAHARARFAEQLQQLACSVQLATTHHPRDLRTKLGKLAELRGRAERIATLRCDHEQLELRVQEQCAALQRALAQPAPSPAPSAAELSAPRTAATPPLSAAEHGGPRSALEPSKASATACAAELSALLVEARAVVAKQREQQSELRHARQQRDELASALAVAQASLAALSEAERSLRADFASELAAHALAPTLTADELLACLDELSLLGQKQRQIAAQRERMAHMERFDAELARDVAGVAAACGLESAEHAPAHVLASLAHRERVYRDAQRDLERSAGELAKLEAQLREHGEGASIEQLRAAVHAFDPDLVRARKLDLDGELESLSENLRELDQRLGGLRAGLARLEEPSSAVELAEQTECELASARALARRYLEVKLALALLTREIERYRAEHQGPVLARASALFPRLTLGRYRGLEVDYDERDEPVLACVQRNGKRVGVLGLSDGTRDQLYLSLRVASIERFLAANVPLPLILDDAFVHFDDARAEAALSVLAELAQRTQVLFFTHHARMVELAKRALGRDGVVVHQLERDSGEVLRDHGPLFA